MHPTGNSGVFLNQSNGNVNVRLLPSPQRQSPYSTFNGVIANNAAIQQNGGLLCIPENNQLLTTARAGVYNNATHTVTESYQDSGYPIGYQNGACISHPYSNGSNGYGSMYGGGQAMYAPPQYNAIIVPGTQTSTPSLFDMIAKSQYNNSKIRRGSGGARRGSCAGKRGSGVGFSGTLSVLTNSLSKNKLKDEQLSLYVSEFAAANYGSVFAQIREVNRESRSECEFLMKSLRILRNTAVMTILLMVVLLLPLGMVILGVKYLHSCPKQPFLPIYLLVGGCFWMLKMFTVLWRQMRERKSSDTADAVDGDENQSDFITDRSTQFTDMVLSLFLLIWFGFGNYWTWKIFKPNFTRKLHTPSDWCEETLYMFCVIQIIVCYSVFVLFMFCVGCLCCARHVFCFADKHKPRR